MLEGGFLNDESHKSKTITTTLFIYVRLFDSVIHKLNSVHVLHHRKQFRDHPAVRPSTYILLPQTSVLMDWMAW